MNEVDNDTSIKTAGEEADLPQFEHGADGAIGAQGPEPQLRDFNMHGFDENVEPVHETQRIGDAEVANEGATVAAGSNLSVEAVKVEGKVELAGEQPFDIFSVDALYTSACC